ncbi:MAG: RHS repeat-associated core domain-containing protein [Candidatus Pacearchaeota archaeon]
MQNEFIANALLVLLPLFMILLLRMGLLYYRFASDNHLKNILHIILIVSFLTSITGLPQRAEAQTPDPGTLVFYHTDHLGSTSVITDATGRVLQLLEYDPWGQVVKDIGDNYAHYRYTGQEFDPEIGLYNYRARLYAPGSGRFISPDPIVPDPATPQALNRYAYVLNNPVNLVDPSGHWSTGDIWSGLKHLGHQIEKHVFRPVAKEVKRWWRETGREWLERIGRDLLNFAINFAIAVVLSFIPVVGIALAMPFFIGALGALAATVLDIINVFSKQTFMFQLLNTVSNFMSTLPYSAIGLTIGLMSGGKIYVKHGAIIFVGGGPLNLARMFGKGGITLGNVVFIRSKSEYREHPETLAHELTHEMPPNFGQV